MAGGAPKGNTAPAAAAVAPVALTPLPFEGSAAKGWDDRAAPTAGDYCSAANLQEATPELNVGTLHHCAGSAI